MAEKWTISDSIVNVLTGGSLKEWRRLNGSLEKAQPEHPERVDDAETGHSEARVVVAQGKGGRIVVRQRSR